MVEGQVRARALLAEQEEAASVGAVASAIVGEARRAVLAAESKELEARPSPPPCPERADWGEEVILSTLDEMRPYREMGRLVGWVRSVVE